MVTALKTKNKVGFVDGSLLMPGCDDPLFSTWERCNTLVLTWIHSSLSTQIGKNILWFDNAHVVWIDLAKHFAQEHFFQIGELQEHIACFKQRTLSIMDYFSKLRILWDELAVLRPIPSTQLDCSCGGLNLMRTYQNSDCVIKFLLGLSETYTRVRSQIML